MQKYRIVFFGTPALSAEILEFLETLPFLEIVGVVSSPDAPIGRKQILTPSPVKSFAQLHNIPVITPPSLKDEAVEKTLVAFGADFFIVVAYGKILPKSILDLPKFGSYNLHFSLLPQYRGASPVQSAILSGESLSGITIFRLTEGLDEGDIFLKTEVSIKGKYADEVFSAMQEVAKEGFQKFFQDFDQLTPLPQQGQSTFCTKFKREDGAISPEEESATEILRKVRAFSPWPGTFFVDKKTNKRIKILKAEESKNTFEHKTPGEILFQNGECVLVTKKGSLLLEAVQPEGKKSISGKEFFDGYQKS